MNISSVRLRMTLWNIGVLALVLFGFLFAAHFSIRSYLFATMDRRLLETSERTERFAQRLRSDSTAFRPRFSVRDEPSGRNRNFHPPRLYQLDGKPYLIPGMPAPTETAPWDRAALAAAVAGETVYTLVEVDGTPYRVLSRPLLRQGKAFAVLQAGTSFAEMQALLDSLTMLSLVLVPAALLLAGVGGLFLTNRALRPVRALAHAADNLHADDLSQRLPVVGADEFAHLAETMNGMLGRLETAFTQLTNSIEHERRFTADASHELRTPLTAIKANTSLALRTERTPAEYCATLRAVDQAADVMHQLVQDLLLLARSDSGQLAVQCQPVDPRKLLEHAVAALPSAPIPVQIAAESDTAIWGDPTHLQRLMVNLLENAVRHTPAEGEVTLSAQASNGGVVVTVADTGEGIAPEHLPHLGERFYRIDAARARMHGGTGLGLAICRSIVDAHHGTLQIASTPGQGTRVTITLPAAGA